jgi:lipopolysaccharide transport system permease protein
MTALSRRQIAAAANDIFSGVLAWNLWHILAMQELRQRYRRSVLGPLWISISLGIQVAVMVFLTAILFQQEFKRYVPYAALGIVLWNFISAAMTEGASCFVAAAPYLLQAKRPLFAFVVHALWRNVVYLGHTAVVYVVVAIVFKVPLGWSVFLLLIALPLVVLNMAWLMLLIGLVATRFRDVQMMLQASLSILFWLTPVIYYPDMLGTHAWIVQCNPLTHLIEIVRAPLLGSAPAAESWFLAIVSALAGWSVAFLMFARFRARVPYWL